MATDTYIHQQKNEPPNAIDGTHTFEIMSHINLNPRHGTVKLQVVVMVRLIPNNTIPFQAMFDMVQRILEGQVGESLGGDEHRCKELL